MVVCGLGGLQELLFKDPAQFNQTAAYLTPHVADLNSFLSWAKLGLPNIENLYDFISAIQPYNMEQSIQGIGSRPVFLNNPAYDTLAGTQSELFFSKLPQPLSKFTVLNSPAPESGVALHSGVFSTRNDALAVYEWLDKVFSSE